MKRVLLFGIWQFVIFSCLFAQSSYNKFIVEGAHWKVDKYYCNPFGSCDAGMGTIIFDTIHNFYKLEGDTTINSLVYKKLWHSQWGHCFGTCGQPTEPYSVIAYLIEDTLNKKVYWKPLTTSRCVSDSILFDFSWQIGDTLMIRDTINDGGFPCSIDSFFVDSSNSSGFQNYSVRTTYIHNLSPLYFPLGFFINQVALYEGIGYSYGFNIDYLYFDGPQLGSTLIYYCVGNDSTCGSNLPTGIENILPDSFALTVQPNPTTGVVAFKSVISQITKIEIIDMNGRCILSSLSNELNVSGLPPAMYFAIIHTSEGIARRRFVKI